ncbi:hypothetical protein USDA257_c25700 [Sinorhizobium fredii USDA 257]|uniref:Uncharacterized protein n=1 Tax=Sinorhizobium fredii (strain USDA 257) TaxID=1185652 RepID=I3X5I9_SINF2|nr:hypothetical protein USDA257_c25700 [Sinorhizobium fredii USDA 257]
MEPLFVSRSCSMVIKPPRPASMGRTEAAGAGSRLPARKALSG